MGYWKDFGFYSKIRSQWRIIRGVMLVNLNSNRITLLYCNRLKGDKSRRKETKKLLEQSGQVMILA